MNWPFSGAFPAPGRDAAGRSAELQRPGLRPHRRPGARRRRDLVEVNFAIRQALAAKYNARFPAADTALQLRCASGNVPSDKCPGNRRWIQLVFDAFLLMPIGPSMVEARDAYLAADLMWSNDPTLSWPSNKNDCARVRAARLRCGRVLDERVLEPQRPRSDPGLQRSGSGRGEGRLQGNRPGRRQHSRERTDLRRLVRRARYSSKQFQN